MSTLATMKRVLVTAVLFASLAGPAH
ncbi:MAG: hypothetical protein QOE36_3096, partial [Gaiellaceae bacterium]|nr:hypothetical protein [Gaiellaceae bacterium]